MGRVLHDGHHDHDRRLPRGPSAVAGRPRVHGASIILSGVGSFFYAFTLFMALLAEGGLAERLGAPAAHAHARRAEGPLHPLRLRPHGRNHRPRVRAAERALRRHRARPRAHARRRWSRASSRSRRTPRTRTCCGACGIERARGFVAAVSTDAENVYAVLSARLLRPDLFIVGRAETEDARTKLLRAGADRVISPYHIGGLQLAQTALRPAVVDFVQLATSSDNSISTWSRCASAPGRRSTAGARSTPSLRQRFGVVVVGIRRTDGQMDFNPDPETAMHAGDDLVVLGRSGSLSDLELTATGSRPAGSASMSAVLLDGQAIAAAIRAEAHARGPGVHRPRRPAAGSRHRAGRRQSGVRGLRPEQGEGGERHRAVGRSPAAAGDGLARASCWRSSIG